jgi:hypothetical protein
MKVLLLTDYVLLGAAGCWTISRWLILQRPRILWVARPAYFKEPLEPFSSQARGFVEPFARIDLIMSYRKNRELFRLAHPLVELFVTFDLAKIVVASPNQKQSARRNAV